MPRHRSSTASMRPLRPLESKQPERERLTEGSRTQGTFLQRSVGRTTRSHLAAVTTEVRDHVDRRLHGSSEVEIRPIASHGSDTDASDAFLHMAEGMNSLTEGNTTLQDTKNSRLYPGKARALRQMIQKMKLALARYETHPSQGSVSVPKPGGDLPSCAECTINGESHDCEDKLQGLLLTTRSLYEVGQVDGRSTCLSARDKQLHPTKLDTVSRYSSIPRELYHGMKRRQKGERDGDQPTAYESRRIDKSRYGVGAKNDSNTRIGGDSTTTTSLTTETQRPRRSARVISSGEISAVVAVSRSRQDENEQGRPSASITGDTSPTRVWSGETEEEKSFDELITWALAQKDTEP